MRLVVDERAEKGRVSIWTTAAETHDIELTRLNVRDVARAFDVPLRLVDPKAHQHDQAIRILNSHR